MFEIYDVAIIPLILGIVALLKGAGFPAKFSPFVAVVLGLAFGVFYMDTSIKQGIIVGLMLGLSATGLYSGTKNVAQIITSKPQAIQSSQDNKGDD
ncbi:hypothetical protein AN964_14010 [Heyndrickxia shackletonii]|uniref:Holin n=1 Tax=Heyndrickxia shackletonii TaxID=157838 RepID=A0A0Q3WZC4_9BACI|nr:hypothetical protein [Heyndrickxia shackletonii]KQL54503.1 hypothetical protein AN964_14010 [Heyndrickxia shackletonii]NEY99231.1 hypothetical protein [Heyndrickxia shackletonii]